eukprot:COSAG05_NODE_1330_length_5154_cov_579.536103_2_plen_88_part_00
MASSSLLLDIHIYFLDKSDVRNGPRCLDASTNRTNRTGPLSESARAAARRAEHVLRADDLRFDASTRNFFRIIHLRVVGHFGDVCEG